MYAIIETGGKQYKVHEGDKIRIEKLSLKPGDKVVFDKVLFIENNGETLIGTPYIPNAKVEGKVLAQVKGEKIIIFKKKSKKGYKKKTGHRQKMSEIQIERIMAESGKAELKEELKSESSEPGVEKKPSKSKSKKLEEKKA